MQIGRNFVIFNFPNPICPILSSAAGEGLAQSCLFIDRDSRVCSFAAEQTTVSRTRHLTTAADVRNEPTWVCVREWQNGAKNVHKSLSFCCMRDPRLPGMRGRFGARHCARFSLEAKRAD